MIRWMVILPAPNAACPRRSKRPQYRTRPDDPRVDQRDHLACRAGPHIGRAQERNDEDKRDRRAREMIAVDDQDGRRRHADAQDFDIAGIQELCAGERADHEHDQHLHDEDGRQSQVAVALAPGVEAAQRGSSPACAVRRMAGDAIVCIADLVAHRTCVTGKGRPSASAVGCCTGNDIPLASAGTLAPT